MLNARCTQPSTHVAQVIGMRRVFGRGKYCILRVMRRYLRQFLHFLSRAILDCILHPAYSFLFFMCSFPRFCAHFAASFLLSGCLLALYGFGHFSFFWRFDFVYSGLYFLLSSWGAGGGGGGRGQGGRGKGKRGREGGKGGKGTQKYERVIALQMLCL